MNVYVVYKENNIIKILMGLYVVNDPKSNIAKNQLELHVVDDGAER